MKLFRTNRHNRKWQTSNKPETWMTSSGLMAKYRTWVPGRKVLLEGAPNSPMHVPCWQRSWKLLTLETVVENLEQMQQDQSADSSESQKAITVTTAQERDDGAETESHKRDP
jgi:hypothetical protein